jgi:S1-C subfamily serine protease
MKLRWPNIWSAALHKRYMPLLLCLIFSAPAVAEDMSPREFLGMPFPDSNRLPSITHEQAGGDERGIELTLDLPSASEIDRLLSARAFLLRGKKEVGINNKVAPATVFIQGSGTCTGSIVTPQGKILTCWHCVRGKSEVYLRLHPAISSGSSPALLRARVERIHPETDLALLQIASPVKDLPVLALGDEGALEVGADVYAVGHPSGLHWTFVKGYISQLHSQFSWSPDRENRHKASVIQSQIPLYEGNSGGPLISDDGNLIGVNATRRDGEQFTFAIALSDIRRFIGTVTEQSLTSTALAKVPASKECRPTRVAARRNTEDTATLVFFDSKCSGKVDTVRFVFDDGRPAFVAKTSELTGKIDTVAVQNGRSQEIYLQGKKNTIKLENGPFDAYKEVEKLEIGRP